MRVLDFGVAVRECFAFENSLDKSSIALLEVMHLLLQRLFFLLQGAGIYVNHGGAATLTNTNVYENEAGASSFNFFVSAGAAFRTFSHSQFLHWPA